MLVSGHASTYLGTYIPQKLLVGDHVIWKAVEVEAGPICCLYLWLFGTVRRNEADCRCITFLSFLKENTIALQFNLKDNGFSLRVQFNPDSVLHKMSKSRTPVYFLSTGGVSPYLSLFFHLANPPPPFSG